MSKKNDVDDHKNEMKEGNNEFQSNAQDGVWGVEFNKSNQCTQLNYEMPSDKKEPEASDFMFKLSSKMFEMAKKDISTTKKNLSKWKPCEKKGVESIPEDSFIVKGRMLSNLKIKDKTEIKMGSNDLEDISVSKKYNMKAKKKFSISLSRKSEEMEETEGPNSSIPDLTTRSAAKSMNEFDEVDGLGCAVFDSEMSNKLVTQGKEQGHEYKRLDNQSTRISRMSVKHEEDAKNLSMNESTEFRDIKWDNETTEFEVLDNGRITKTTSLQERNEKNSDIIKDESSIGGSEYNDKSKLSEIEVDENEDVAIIPKQRKKRKTTDISSQSKKRKLESGEALDVS